VLQQNGVSADADSVHCSSAQELRLAPLQESAALAAARAVHRRLHAQHCAVFRELLQWCCASSATADDGAASASADRLAQVSLQLTTLSTIAMRLLAIAAMSNF
jgi:hypothetical protein